MAYPLFLFFLCNLRRFLVPSRSLTHTKLPLPGISSMRAATYTYIQYNIKHFFCKDISLLALPQFLAQFLAVFSSLKVTAVAL